MTELQLKTSQNISRYLQTSGWIEQDTSVHFLAAGEYNENYLVETKPDGHRYVFRINHGSQLGLPKQIEYEYQVLRALKESGVTPQPYRYELSPEGINGGCMLMEYIPGHHLDYHSEAGRAATVFAVVHDVLTDDGTYRTFVRQQYPITDIAGESLGLINRFPDHPLTEERTLLLQYYEKIRRLAEDRENEFAAGKQCIVNTEVNSSNFLVNDRKTSLVDWEKAVISTPFQDLGHFLVETSTRWKGNYVFTQQEKQEFLSVYREQSDTHLSLSELQEMTTIMEKTILLRALSWCFMAWYEYNCTQRALCNKDTAETINQYLREIRWLLQ